MEIAICPQCGASATPSARSCQYCSAEFFVSSIAYLSAIQPGETARYLKTYKELLEKNATDPGALLGMGLCYLSMKSDALAKTYFKKAIDHHPDVAPPYYYFALTLVNGRRIATINLNEARQLENYLSLALSIDPDASHAKLLLAMVKRDYYETNGMRVGPPTADTLLGELTDKIIVRSEIDRLLTSAKVANPEVYTSRVTVTD